MGSKATLKPGVGATKIDNTDLEGKISLRQRGLSLLGKHIDQDTTDAANCTVLEAFAGEGHIHDACYTKAYKHIGMDLKSIKRPGWIQGDNRILLPKHINDGWNVIDLDAYSNPWALAYTVCKLREPGVWLMFTTCCMRRTLTSGNAETSIRKMTGIGNLPKTPLFVRFYDEIVKQCVSSWSEQGVRVLKGERARSRRLLSKTNYYSFLVEKS